MDAARTTSAADGRENPRTRTLFQLDDIVKIHKNGSTIFTVVDFADDGRPIVEPIGDAPGKYPRTADPAYLVHVTPGAASEDVSS